MAGTSSPQRMKRGGTFSAPFAEEEGLTGANFSACVRAVRGKAFWCMLPVDPEARLRISDTAATLMAERNSHTDSPDLVKQALPGSTIIVFVALQALDVITTLIGIRAGAQEANITVARLMALGPTTGLLVAKLLGLLLIIAVFVRGKVRLVRLLNLWFAGIVTWNLVMIWIQRWIVLTR